MSGPDGQMGQATISPSAGNTEPSASAEPNDSESEDEDPFKYIEYLDANSLSLIHALAMSLNTVEEVDKYIDAEEKRWDRDAVLRILRRRRETLERDQ